MFRVVEATLGFICCKSPTNAEFSFVREIEATALSKRLHQVKHLEVRYTWALDDLGFVAGIWEESLWICYYILFTYNYLVTNVSVTIKNILANIIWL